MGEPKDDARIRRAPAVWGDAAPDYSAVKLGNAPYRYLYALLFVDDKITGFYEYDMVRVKSNILKVVEEANTYFNQLRLGIVVVDVMQTMRSNLSLLHKLPAHDFAALITYRYAGGLAFVGGLCSDKAVMLCGHHLAGRKFTNYDNLKSNIADFFESQPPEFWAKGIGDLPNRWATVVDYCAYFSGFDHDCTAQQFVNVMYQKKCIRTEPLESISEPICGNAVVERDEECDCGLTAQCDSWNCRPETCTYQVQPAILVSPAFCDFTCQSAQSSAFL
ncbi:unnamed protein product [Heligmosomoides polygyrus]|uniref:VWFA domain-containing protein n=1 Tax=Heligmosomoides polygyrus TaxID=6339 RepID=A0A3P7Z2A7_HELPZ|nr:unnamed protein product [Heligmosomoides polygyrus]